MSKKTEYEKGHGHGYIACLIEIRDYAKNKLYETRK